MKYSFSIWPKSRINERDLSYASSMGFENIEVSLEYPWPFWDSNSFNEIMKLLRDQGFSLGAHLPWRDLVIASPYEEVRRGAIAYIMRLLEVMTKWDFKYAVAHFSTREKVKFGNRDYLSPIILEMKDAAEKFKDAGIIFAVENAPYGPLAVKESFVQLLRELDGNACLDLGHVVARLISNGENQLSMVESMINDWVSSIAEKTSVVHVHGVAKINGNVVEHMRISGYEKYFAKSLNILEKLGRDPFVTLEVFFKDERLVDADIETVIRELSLLKEARISAF
ncbi:MAG: sugar phosphate isomerase/epimerase [Fervidicoccaceae archaeon]